MFSFLTFASRTNFKSTESRSARHSRVRFSPEILEGRELLSATGGRVFHPRANFGNGNGVATVSRLQNRPALNRFANHGFLRNSAITPNQDSPLNRPVRNPNPISRFDPYGQFKTKAATPPTATNPTGGPSTPVSDPSLVSPVDPYGEFRTNAADPPSETNPTGGPSEPVKDPSLVSSVDPYGQFRLK